MKKNIISTILILILINLGTALALEECGDSTPINKDCTLISPYISYCSTYDLDIYYSNGTSFASDATISQIGTSGIYNYTVNFILVDTYIVKLCDDSIRTITTLDPDSWTLGTSWWSYLIQIYHYTLAGGY